MRIDTFSSSAALLAAALLLAACADDATEPGSSQPACLALAHTAEVDWQPAAEIGGDGALLSVWGTGPCDVYTVGGQPDAGVAYHFDGTDWTALELPAVPLLNWVFGVGDTVWIVGNGGTVLRGSATAGFELVESGTTAPLWGVWGSSPSRLFAVGGDVQDDTSEPVAIAFDGQSWSSVELPATDRPAHALFKVWGTADDHAIAVGQFGIAYRWDGTRWTALSTGTGEDLISLWGRSADDITIIGGRSNAVLGHWDGEALTAEVLAGTPGMNGVWVDGDGDASVVGIFGTAGRIGAADKTVDLDVTGTTDVLHGIWGVQGGPRFAVGGSLQRNPPWTGVVLIDP